MTEEQQTAELADALEALEARYAAIPPALKDELRGLKQRFRDIAAYKQGAQAQRVIGQTHLSIRDHQDATDTRVARFQEQQTATDSRIAGAIEEMVGLHEEQDTTAAHLIEAARAFERLVARVRRLEQDVAQLMTPRSTRKRPAAQHKRAT